MLDIQTLTAIYDQEPILRGVSLSVAPGEILGLIGPNGAGKSTLIRAVSGVISPKSGRVRIAGQDILALSEPQRARFLSVVPQARSLPGAFTVRQTVSLGRTPYLGWLGIPSLVDQQAVQKSLHQTGLEHLADRRVGELSGGEQQLVLLARALCQQTPVMLLDEPTTHLDLKHQAVLLALLRELAHSCQLAVMVVLHDLSLAGLFADRIALLRAGQIFTQGTPADVLTQHNLSLVYDVPVHVLTHPEYGTPLVLPDGISAAQTWLSP